MTTQGGKMGSSCYERDSDDISKVKNRNELLFEVSTGLPVTKLSYKPSNQPLLCEVVHLIKLQILLYFFYREVLKEAPNNVFKRF